MYLDGEVIMTGILDYRANTIINQNSYIGIGKDNYNDMKMFPMAECRIYDRGLSDEEVLMLNDIFRAPA